MPEVNAFAYGFSVELAEGGPWLGQDGSVVLDYAERGSWPTHEAAEAALRRSLSAAIPTQTNHE